MMALEAILSDWAGELRVNNSWEKVPYRGWEIHIGKSPVATNFSGGHSVDYYFDTGFKKPGPPGGWTQVGEFKNREEAIAAAKRRIDSIGDAVKNDLPHLGGGESLFSGIDPAMPQSSSDFSSEVGKERYSSIKNVFGSSEPRFGVYIPPYDMTKWFYTEEEATSEYKKWISNYVATKMVVKKAGS